MTRNNMNMIAMVLVSLLFMTACGGGGGGSTTTASTSGGSGTPDIVASKSTVDFGGVVLKNSADNTIVVKNNGNADLVIGNVTHPNSPFSITSETCSNTTLNPTESCNIYLYFKPMEQGVFESSFSIPSNDPDLSSINISLKGHGNSLSTWIDKVSTGACPSPDISVNAAVADPSGTDLTSLNLANFMLYENGTVIDPSKISLSNIQQTPVSVVLAMDWSESVTQITTTIANAGKFFVDQLDQADEAAIWRYNNQIEIDPITPTFIIGDDPGKALLKAFIDSPMTIDPGTKLYDSVFQSIDRAAMGSKGKRVVIVLSDGVEAPGSTTSTIKTIDEVINHAKSKGIPVFTVYYVDPTFNGGTWGNPQLLQRLADETGGKYYNSQITDLTTVINQIFKVISNNYTFTYKSASSCSGTLTLGINVNYNGLLGDSTKTIILP